MMPRKMMDYRMMRDGRNPYGSEGGYVTTSRRSRRGRRDRAMSRGMDYAYDRRDYRSSDMEYDSRRGDYAYNEQDNERSRRDYESNGQYDMGYDYADMRRRRNSRGQYMPDRGYEPTDYGFHEERGFKPVEAMGYFTGYYGGGEDYGYDMRGRGRDYGYYDMGGDYGETLTKEELEHWKKKLMEEVDDKYKSFFTKENIASKAKQLGVQMEGFSEEELLISVLMTYTDYCKALKPYIGENMDAYVKLGHAFLVDKDSPVKGGEKLAIYFDNIVEAD